MVYLPGFNGFLAPRYNIDGTIINTDLWRDRTIFRVNANELKKSVQVTNHEDSVLSFKVERLDNQYFFTKKNKTKPISTKNGIKYFNLFKHINCEGFMNDYSPKDSILDSKPYYTIEVQQMTNSQSFSIATTKVLTVSTTPNSMTKKPTTIPTECMLNLMTILF